MVRGDETSMTKSGEAKARYALGLFVSADQLERALTELRETGLPLAQIKVIIPPLSSGANPSWSERAAALGADTWVASESANRRGDSGVHCPWDFAPVHLSQRESATKRDVMPDFHIWALERHAQQLDRHLRRGGAIAIVEVRNDGEERAAYSALLRHATAGVQTHEVSRHS